MLTIVKGIVRISEFHSLDYTSLCLYDHLPGCGQFMSSPGSWVQIVKSQSRPRSNGMAVRWRHLSGRPELTGIPIFIEFFHR
jgi:hypothetical protein